MSERGAGGRYGSAVRESSTEARRSRGPRRPLRRRQVPRRRGAINGGPWPVQSHADAERSFMGPRSLLCSAAGGMCCSSGARSGPAPGTPLEMCVVSNPKLNRVACALTALALALPASYAAAQTGPGASAPAPSPSGPRAPLGAAVREVGGSTFVSFAEHQRFRPAGGRSGGQGLHSPRDERTDPGEDRQGDDGGEAQQREQQPPRHPEPSPHGCRTYSHDSMLSRAGVTRTRGTYRSAMGSPDERRSAGERE